MNSESTKKKNGEWGNAVIVRNVPLVIASPEGAKQSH